MERRFFRKSNDKVFGGVCSGLADYVGIDKSLVRILTLVGIIASGVIPGLFLYFLCVIIVPYDTQANDAYYNRNTDSSRNTESNQSDGNRYTESNRYTEESNYSSGRDYNEPRDNGSSRVVFGAILVGVGVFLFARMFFGWLDWRYVFAGLLILGGLYMLFGRRR